MDHPSFKACTPVTVIFGDGTEVTAFLDLQFGWMDQRGVALPPGRVPIAWRPL